MSTTAADLLHTDLDTNCMPDAEFQAMAEYDATVALIERAACAVSAARSAMSAEATARFGGPLFGTSRPEQLAEAARLLSATWDTLKTLAAERSASIRAEEGERD